MKFLEQCTVHNKCSKNAGHHSVSWPKIRALEPKESGFKSSSVIMGKLMNLSELQFPHPSH